MIFIKQQDQVINLHYEVKEEWEKADLKLNIQKTKILVSGPITLWQMEREKVKLMNFVFLGSKITAYSDCSHEIKRHLLFGRKAMTNLYSILKSRDITLLTKVHSQHYGFSSSYVQM